MQRAATISRFQLIWKGGAGKIPVGAAGGHPPGLIPHPWAAFGTPPRAVRKSPWKGLMTHSYFIPSRSQVHI